MASLEEKISRLEALLATGATETKQGDDYVKLDTRANLKAQLRDMKAELAGRKRASAFRMLTPRTGRGL